MKNIITLIAAAIITTTTAYAAETVNPFTGSTLKTNNIKSTDTKPSSPLMPPSPNTTYIPPPIPNYQMPNMSGMQQPKPEEKKKEIDPKERFEVAGVVNDNIIIKDVLNEDKLIYVENYSSLDNGCVVRYPDVICGKDGEKALRNHSDKEGLTRKLVNAAKENGDLKTKIATLTRNLTHSEDKIRLLEPKASKTDSLTKKLEDVETINKKIETEASETKSKLSTLEKYQSEKEKLTLEISALKKSNGDLIRKVSAIEPQLLTLQNEIATHKNISKEAMMDMSLITDILYNSTMDTDYNIPKIGKFKGVLTKDFFYAFVPVAQREKADVYFRNVNKRAYKTDKYILYINDKKFIEE